MCIIFIKRIQQKVQRKSRRCTHLKTNQRLASVSLFIYQFSMYNGGKAPWIVIGSFQPDDTEIIALLNICWKSFHPQPNTNSLPQGFAYSSYKVFCQELCHYANFLYHKHYTGGLQKWKKERQSTMFSRLPPASITHPFTTVLAPPLDTKFKIIIKVGKKH